MRRVLVDDDQPVLGLRRRCRSRASAPRAAPSGRATVGGRPAASARDVGGRRGRRRERRLRRLGEARGDSAALPAIGGRPPARRRRPERPRAAGPERRDGRAVPPPVELRGPLAANASRSAPTIRPRTSPGSRKRTSALAGWTLTSTCRGSSVDEQRRHRMAVALHEVGIGGAERAEEQLVAHRPAVDEEELRERRCRG